MGYDPEEWVDDDGSGTVGTVFNASRMNHIEQGIVLAMPPGSILPTASIKMPSGWLACDGSEVSRATYADLFRAITASATGDRTSGSAVLTGIASTSDIEEGADVVGDGVQAGSKVSSIDSSSQITLTKTLTSTGNDGEFIAMPYGSAASSNNFKLPDLIGRVPIGRDPDAKRITLTNNHQGQTGGAETHKHAATGLTATTGGPSAATGRGDSGTSVAVATNSHTHTVTMGGNTANALGLPPFQVTRWMVKT